MVYAMMSIGLLGFLVWSYIKMALFIGDYKVINFAICWNSCQIVDTFYSENSNNYVCQWHKKAQISTTSMFKIHRLVATQSARNNQPFFSSTCNFSCSNIAKDQIRSSETIRKNSFYPSHSTKQLTMNKFDIFIKGAADSLAKLAKKPADHYDWLCWFIGFIEGDGAIQKHKNKIYFVLTQKEGDILYHIQKVQNIGNVKYFPQGKTHKNGFYRFFVNKKEEIYLLILLFNGNQILKSRQKQLKSWILEYNRQIEKQQDLPPIIFKPTQEYNLADNSWLAGFTDAVGCFNVTISKRKETKTGYRIHMRYILDLKGEQEVLEKIKKEIGFGSVTIRKSADKSAEHKNMYRFTITSFKALKHIIDYFTKYPLKSKKSKDYKNWNIIYSMVDKKQHLSHNGLNIIKNIKKTINLGNSLNRSIGHSFKDKKE